MALEGVMAPDWRAILKDYIRTVCECEGVTFIGPGADVHLREVEAEMQREWVEELAAEGREHWNLDGKWVPARP